MRQPPKSTQDWKERGRSESMLRESDIEKALIENWTYAVLKSPDKMGLR